MRFKRNHPPCKCGRPYYAKGLCKSCYFKQRKNTPQQRELYREYKKTYNQRNRTRLSQYKSKRYRNEIELRNKQFLVDRIKFTENHVENCLTKTTNEVLEWHENELLHDNNRLSKEFIQKIIQGNIS